MFVALNSLFRTQLFPQRNKKLINFPHLKRYLQTAARHELPLPRALVQELEDKCLIKSEAGFRVNLADFCLSGEDVLRLIEALASTIQERGLIVHTLDLHSNSIKEVDLPTIYQAITPTTALYMMSSQVFSAITLTPLIEHNFSITECDIAELTKYTEVRSVEWS